MVLGFFAIAMVACYLVGQVGEAPLSTALTLPFFKNVIVNLA